MELFDLLHHVAQQAFMARTLQLLYYTPAIVQENAAHQRKNGLAALGHHVGFNQPGRKRQARHPKDPRFVLAGLKAQGPQFLVQRPADRRRQDDILSSDTAILGRQTNIGPGGSLTALNGALLGNPSSVDATKVLTATGNATINANFVNNGVVNGPTTSGQELTFTQAVQGAGSTTGNVEYAASYRPGNSPDAVSVQNILLDSTSTLILELGGDVPGSGYDQLEISGLATLNGTLELSYLDGFTPSVGESFHVLNGSTTGSFVGFNLAPLPPGLSWDTSALDSQGTITVTPEPGTFALLAAGAVAFLGYGWRRRAARTAKAAAFDKPQDDPLILSFPSHSVSANAARRAA